MKRSIVKEDEDFVANFKINKIPMYWPKCDTNYVDNLSLYFLLLFRALFGLLEGKMAKLSLKKLLEVHS